MDLPRVTLSFPKLPPLPAVIQARVEAVTGPNAYVFDFAGTRLELRLDLSLAPGDRLAFRVREQTPARLVLEVLPSAEGPPPAPVDGEIPDALRDVAREFRRMGAPLDRPLLELAARVSSDPAARQAAAFLAAHGFDPEPARVEPLARLALPPAPAQTGADILLPLARALQGLEARTPEEVASTAPRLAGPPPREAHDAIRTLLDSSPRLRLIDRVIETLDSLPPSPAAPARPENRDAVDRVVDLAGRAPPDRAEEVLREVARTPREALPELRERLLDLERREIAALPEMAAARAGRGRVLEAAERLEQLRLVNQLATLRDDGVMVLQIPVRDAGGLRYVPLVARREGGRPGAGRSPVTRVSIEADLTRMGHVGARLEAAGTALRVDFRVRDARVRAHLEAGAPELAAALEARGFRASVRAEVAPAAGPAGLLDAFALPGSPGSIDVSA